MRVLHCLLLALTLGCSKSSPPPPPRAMASPRPVDAGPATAATKRFDRQVVEVELSGTFDRTRVKASDYLLYISAEPCSPLPKTVTSWGEMKPQKDSADFFIEIFPLAGSRGYVCALALDGKGQVIAIAAHPGNPLTFVGQGEVEFFDIPLVLQKVAAQPKPEWKRSP